MLARMPSSELTEWMVYEREYGPLGPERSDYLAALVSATTAAAMQGKKGRRIKIRDFLPEWARPKRQTAKEQLDVLRTFVRKLGGEETKRGDNR